MDACIWDAEICGCFFFLNVYYLSVLERLLGTLQLTYWLLRSMSLFLRIMAIGTLWWLPWMIARFTWLTLTSIQNKLLPGKKQLQQLYVDPLVFSSSCFFISIFKYIHINTATHLLGESHWPHDVFFTLPPQLPWRQLWAGDMGHWRSNVQWGLHY